MVDFEQIDSNKVQYITLCKKSLITSCFWSVFFHISDKHGIQKSLQLNHLKLPQNCQRSTKNLASNTAGFFKDVWNHFVDTWHYMVKCNLANIRRKLKELLFFTNISGQN